MSKDSRTRGAKAIAAAAVLCIVSLLAWKGEGFDAAKLSISLFFAVLAGVFIWKKENFTEKTGILVSVLIPLSSFLCTELYTHAPWDLSVPVFVINLLFYFLLYGIFMFLTGSVRRGYLIATLIPMTAGLANYFVVSFRSSPVVPWDLFSLGTAVTITDNYTFNLTYRAAFVLIAFVWMILVSSKLDIKIKRAKIRVPGFVMCCLCMAGYLGAIRTEAVMESAGFEEISSGLNMVYRKNGFMGSFFSNLRYINVEKPENYSAEKVEEIEKQYQAAENAQEEQPNLIVIMNEAFADLSYLADFETNEDYMPNFHALKENTVKGNLFVGVKGGNTANTEFEFLTGDTLAFLPPGSVAYQQFVKGETPSLADHLEKLGYTTLAIHPYYPTGWNRQEVYEEFGFDEMLFLESFENPEKIREYVSDQSAFAKIMEEYEKREDERPLFVFEVTMQNHGGYSKEYPGFEPTIKLTQITDQTDQVRATEKYLTLIRKSDEAFGELLDYFSGQQEKTVILMFGDHQPADDIADPILKLNGIDREASLEEYQKGYVVPFVIWANYEIEEENIDKISANYLGTVLMEKAGLPLSGYQTYLSQLREVMPVITSGVVIDQENVYHTLSEEVLEKERNEYAILQYNHLVDPSNREDTFFEN